MIERAQHMDNFTIIDNGIMQEGLTDAAFRLLVFMLTCSDNWQFSINGLMSRLGWTREKTANALTELKQHGHIRQVNHKDEHGHFSSCEWFISELPQYGKTELRNHRTTESPKYGKTVVRKTSPKQVLNITSTNNNKDELKKSKPKEKPFKPPTLEEVRAYCQERKNDVDPERFIDYYTANGWHVGKNKMKDWRAAVRTWEKGTAAQHCLPKQKVKEDDPIDWSEVEAMAIKIAEGNT